METSPIIAKLDPARNIFPRLFSGRVDSTVDKLDLQRAIQRFGERIVIADPCVADGLAYLQLPQFLGELTRRVIAAPVAQWGTSTQHHGGTDQAVYAYAREDLDWWERELGYELPAGRFGENLTTQGLDLTGTLVGECWRIGETVVLQATSPRIPCATFAHRIGEPKWVKRFTARGATGTHLRVIVPGEIKAGDRIDIIRRPRRTVTIGQTFRALTTEPDLLPALLKAGDDLPPQERAAILRRTA